MNKTAFTADTHFGHQNIIKYCNRPFANATEMDKVLIDNWNSVCDPETTVYHLGDFAFGRTDYVANIISRLQFRHLYVIKGNHDKPFCEWYRIQKMTNGGTNPQRITLFNSYLETRIEGTDFTLCHYAMRVWNKCHHGSCQLHGHSHGTLTAIGKQLDVGVDNGPVEGSYRPWTLDEVTKYMKSRSISSQDHHISPK